MADPPIPDLSAVASPPRRSITYSELNTADDPLGAGGQAVVYEATLPDNAPPDRVALKEPGNTSQTQDQTTIERFFEEASTWETLDRRERQKPRWSDVEHIVGIIDIGEDLPWIAMEYMDGGSLHDRFATHPDGFPIDEALWIGESICRGIELAHNYGVAHLDLKPANILFRETSDDTWDVPKIGDWGLARLLAMETGTLDGLSVEYAAPEQFDADEFGDPDMLTDIYQTGALVYALVTGTPPYTGGQTSVMYDIINSDGPIPPSESRSELPAAVDAAVNVALARSKADRYRSITTFAQTLQAIRTDQPLPPIVAQHIETDHTTPTGRSSSAVDSSERIADPSRSQPSMGSNDEDDDVAETVNGEEENEEEQSPASTDEDITIPNPTQIWNPDYTVPQESYIVILWTEADEDTTLTELDPLRENFDHYSTYLSSDVLTDKHELVTANETGQIIISHWETKSSAETAAGFLKDLPGVSRWKIEEYKM